MYTSIYPSTHGSSTYPLIYPSVCLLIWPPQHSPTHSFMQLFACITHSLLIHYHPSTYPFTYPFILSSSQLSNYQATLYYPPIYLSNQSPIHPNIHLTASALNPSSTHLSAHPLNIPGFRLLWDDSSGSKEAIAVGWQGSGWDRNPQGCEVERVGVAVT